MSEPTYTREQFLNSCITPAISSPFISTECSICQEQYCDSTDGCAVTFSDEKTCNHVFCRACITTWLSAKSVNTCALCRRVLFALENPPWVWDDDDDDDDDDEGEDDDDDDDDEYDEEYDEDEELDPLLNSESAMRDLEILPLRIYTADRNYILPQQIILETLTSIWYKTWWLLSSYRRYVFYTRNNFLGIYVWLSHQGRVLLPKTICLMHTLLYTVTSALGVDSTCLYGETEMEVLQWLVQDIAACLKAHIDVTGGIDCVPDFPPWKQRIWGEPLQWLLASRKGSEYTRAPTPL